jgi:hypothetical protein
MGSALAIREDSATVPGTPEDTEMLRSELQYSAEKLDVISRLRAYGEAIQIIDQTKEDADYYLLELDTVAMRVNVAGYRHSELAKASSDYLNVEKSISAGSGNDAVLVSADSMSALTRAYPNYFLDTHRFLEAVASALQSL